MKIAMIGHKDFPSRSGGVEVVVCELSRRLAAAGDDVTVYNRGTQKHHNSYRELGVRVRRIPTPKKESLNAAVYSFLATFDALFRGFDIIHYHAIGPSVPLLLAHIFGKRTVSTIHGLNWRCDKWGKFASAYLKLGEKIAARFADEVIVLSEEMRDYFMITYGRRTCLVKNAVTPVPDAPCRLIREKYGLQKGEYIFYVGRISPEKGPSDLVAAFKKTRTDKKLVIAGEIPENDYGREIRSLAEGDERIVFPGFVEGEILHEFYQNCALYVLPSHTEGLALTLLEAMSCGVPCLVSDIPENTSVLGNFGYSFETRNIDDLAEKLDMICESDDARIDAEGQKKYIAENYSYDSAVEKTREIYERVISRKNRKHIGESQ